MFVHQQYPRLLKNYSSTSKGLFGYEFEWLKSVFNIQKVSLKEKVMFDKKKIESIFKGPKIVKTYFWQKFKNEAFEKKKN